jgi:hypothetical protein
VNTIIQSSATIEAAINHSLPLARMFLGRGGGAPEGLRLFLDRETPASSRDRVTSLSASVLRAVAMIEYSLSK